MQRDRELLSIDLLCCIRVADRLGRDTGRHVAARYTNIHHNQWSERPVGAHHQHVLHAITKLH